VTLLFGLSACASAARTRVTELSSNEWEVVALASSEITAEEDALEGARRVCAKRGPGLEPLVLAEDCYYRGMNRQSRAGMAVAGALLGNMVGTYGAGQARHDVRGTTVDDEPFRFVLRFGCAPPHQKSTQEILKEIF
jgi:hypothetical protein